MNHLNTRLVRYSYGYCTLGESHQVNPLFLISPTPFAQCIWSQNGQLSALSFVTSVMNNSMVKVCPVPKHDLLVIIKNRIIYQTKWNQNILGLGHNVCHLLSPPILRVLPSLLICRDFFSFCPFNHVHARLQARGTAMSECTRWSAKKKRKNPYK